MWMDVASGTIWDVANLPKDGYGLAERPVQVNYV